MRIAPHHKLHLYRVLAAILAIGLIFLLQYPLLWFGEKFLPVPIKPLTFPSSALRKQPIGLSNRQILGPENTKLGLFPAPPLGASKTANFPLPPYIGSVDTIEQNDLPGVWDHIPVRFLKKSGTSWKRTLAGHLLYNISVTADRWGRRTLPGRENGAPALKRYFALFGCSFVFGSGVKDDDTLAANLERLLPDTRAYNYGVPSYSPPDAYLRMQQIQRGDLLENKGIILYIYIDEHLGRIAGPMSFVGTWAAEKNHYYVDNSGDIRTDGTFSEVWPIRTTIYKYLANNYWVKRLNLEFPWWMGKDDWAVFRRSLQLMRDYSEQKLNAQFYIVIYPGAWRTAQLVIPHIEAAGIRYIDFSHWDLNPLTDGKPYIPYDVHPTAEANKVFAKAIIDALNLKLLSRQIFPLAPNIKANETKGFPADSSSRPGGDGPGKFMGLHAC